MPSNIYRIDEEMELDGVQYWCNAVIHVVFEWLPFDRVHEPLEAHIDDIRLFSYTASNGGYEDEVCDPRILEKAKALAKEWAVENAELR